MTISIDYPTKITFKVSKDLPEHDNESICVARTNLLHEEIVNHEYEVQHHPYDFVVERVKVMPWGEVWRIGS
jgi:hypothetical protein